MPAHQRRVGWWIACVVATLLAFAVAVLHMQFSREMDAQRQRVSTGSRMVQTCRGAVEMAEAGEGPPILVAHGSGGGFDQAMMVGEDLAARGLHVIAPSRFGYLRTPFPEDASPQAQADQFACLLDALGIGQTAIVGISAGANSAIQFAIRHPERTSALILLVPAAYAPRASTASHTASGSPPEASLLGQVLASDFAFWFANRYAHPMMIQTVLATPTDEYIAAGEAERARADRVLSEILPIGLRHRGLMNDAEVSADPPRYDLETIRAPTLIVSARDDLFGTHAAAQYTAEQIPGAQFIDYDRGGHAWLGHHADVVASVTEFVLEHRVEGKADASE